MQGIASVTLDGMIAIHDIKILKNDSSMFLAMPSRPTKSSTFKDVVDPVNSEVRQVFERLIFAAYEMAENLNCGNLESILKEERKNSHLLDLRIEDYSIGRISGPIALQTTTNSVQNTMNMQQKERLQKRTDSELLKWLEGKSDWK